jgi:hypothetical protein
MQATTAGAVVFIQGKGRAGITVLGIGDFWLSPKNHNKGT